MSSQTAEALSKFGYTYMRTFKHDGNEYYRAVYFAYFELLIKKCLLKNFLAWFIRLDIDL